MPGEERSNGQMEPDFAGESGVVATPASAPVSVPGYAPAALPGSAAEPVPASRIHNIHRRALLAGGAGAAALTMLAACAPGSDQGGAVPEKKASGIKTDIASLGNITLTVWDQEVRGGQKAQIEALNSAFMKKYPNVKIARTSQSFDDLKKTTALALSGNEVPDVVQVNNARADMGEFVKAGQLTSLTPYAEKYGWKDRYAPSVLAKTSYSKDGVTFGEGDLYGLPQTGEIVGVFYSKKKLQAIGVQPPKSWEEFFAALEAAAKKKEQPMLLGNIEKWPGLHVFGPLQAKFVPGKDIVALAMGNKGASWTTDQNTQALTTLGEWGKNGWLGKSPNGQDYDAAWKEFTQGKAVFLPGGSWLAADMEAAMKDDLGFLPAFSGADGSPATTGGTGIPFAVPAKAKQPDAAAAYINFITSDEAMKVLAENGNMPVNKTLENAPKHGVQKDIFSAFDQVSTKGMLLPYLDYATPSFADTCGNGVQGVIGGTAAPEEALQRFEDDYTKFTSAS